MISTSGISRIASRCAISVIHVAVDVESLRNAREELLRHVRNILDAAEAQNRRVTDEEAAEIGLTLEFAADLLQQIRNIEHNNAA
jgi:hypothetical protein